MCLKNTDESCVLLERMVKVESKLGMVIFLFVVLIGILTVFSFKLLNAQLLLVNGIDGLRAIGQETHKDFHLIATEVK